MEISIAQESDLAEMIALLRKSLGEKLIPKSEAFFTWKHDKNPFGKSKTLLAKDEGKIIGLRTFMHWNWVRGNELVKAVRAVDTATDPAFQGKGIFRKLTMSAVESCIDDGIGLVFNTPNPISMQGYLKMGWHIAGRMPLLAGPGHLLPAKFTLDTELKMSELFPIVPLQDIPFSNTFFHTPVTKKYLQWRFRDCPVVTYGSVIEKDFGFVFRLKPVKSFFEMRICEIWNADSTSAKALKKSLKNCIGQLKPAIVTCAPSPLTTFDRPLNRMLGPFKKGPLTTLRPLAQTDLDDFNQFKNWQPSIGSLELF